MNFLYPWTLLAIPVAIWLLRRKRKRTPVTVASIHEWPQTLTGRARLLWIPPFLRAAAIVLLIIAIAGPQAGSDYDVEISEGIAIQLLVDVSSSMDMGMSSFGGKSQSRMEIAKEMVALFIEGDGDTLKGRPNDLIGLITFARYADTRSPLTFGHNALLQIVRSLEIQERPNEDGTAYGDALAIAAARLNKLEELKNSLNAEDLDAIQSKVIILLTDGENNSGSHMPIESAGLAKEWGCRIYAISMGEAMAYSDNENETEQLTAAEKVLEHISNQTGGIFRQATDSESLRSIYQEIDRLERSKIATRSMTRVLDWFWLPLAISMLCLLAALVLESTYLRVVP